MNKRQFVSELAKLRSSATFLTLKGYRNEYSEVADYSILFHMSYENALKRRVAVLEKYVPVRDLEVTAKKELLKSFSDSLYFLKRFPAENRGDGYAHYFLNDRPIKGVKLHLKSDNLHLYGLVVHKKVIMLGSYPLDSRNPRVIVKDRLRKMCPVGQYRQFKIVPSQVDSISVENLSLLPPV
jgi:hypothetical protein